MNRKYEVLLLLNPNLEKENLEKLIKDIEFKMAGNIIKKEEWGIRKLAYKIEKSRKAYYILYFVETTPEAIMNLKTLISIKKEIIRPMILRHEKKWPYEYKTGKDLLFPERKPKREFKSRYPRTEKIIVESTVKNKSLGSEND